MKTLIRIVTAAIALGAGAGTLQARYSGSSLSREAHRVVDDANQLTREVNLHFRHSSGYRHLLRDAAEIRGKAEHIDELSHHLHGIDDLRHLQDDLEDLDELVHHVAELVEDISHGRGHGHGHTHGDTHHVERLIASLNRSLHSMERMASEMGRRCRHGSGRGHGSRYEVRVAAPSLGEHIAGRVLQRVFRRR